MLTTLRSNNGSALVATLFFITALTITATVIVWVTGSERRVSHNEYTYTRSFYASDAGGETAINWIRTRQIPPRIVNPDSNYVAELNDYVPIHDDQSYLFTVRFDRVRFRPGWSQDYRDFDYTVDTRGTSVQESSARIEVRTSRLFRWGY